MIVYDMCHPRTTEDRTRVIRQWLASNNPQWLVGGLWHDRETDTVRIRGRGFRSLLRTLSPGSLPESRVNLLCLLGPKSLDLRGTDVDDLKQLVGLELEDVDLRATNVRNLSAVRQLPTLRRIVVSPGQVSSAERESVPVGVEVVVANDGNRAADFQEIWRGGV